MVNKKPLVKNSEDWQKHRKAVDCHICNKSLFKDLFLDSIPVHDLESGKYGGQSHRRCRFEAMEHFMGLQRERKAKDEIDQ